MDQKLDLTEVISSKLKSALPGLQDLHIQDKSGGCGQSYLVIVIAEEFKEMKLLQRQQLVNDILAAEIA